MNHTNGALDLWESNMGHNSLYSYYTTLESDSTYDDWESDSLRHPDKIFERILNEDQEYRIGDTIYSYDFELSELTLYDNISGNSYVQSINSIYNFKNASTCYSVQKGADASGPMGNGGLFEIMIRMDKVQNNYVRAKAFTSNIFFTLKHYRKNTLGLWKKTADSMRSILDRWHEIRLNSYNWDGTSFTQNTDDVYTEEKWIVADHKEIQWTLHYQQGYSDGTITIPYLLKCVENWERHHVFTKGNWNNDVHHDFW